jgi:perosamine synthetase
MTSPLALLGGTPAVTQPGPHFTWPPVDGETAATIACQLGTAVSIDDRSGIIADLEDSWPATSALGTRS